MQKCTTCFSFISQRVGECCPVRWLLFLQAILLAYSATLHSPTELEPALLVSGISHWEFGRFELYRVNPPLVRLVAAIPILALDFNSDWSQFFDAPGSRAEFPLGADFVRVNGVGSVRLFWYARWVCIPFCMTGAYFAWRWAAELYGEKAGLLTLVLFVFDPNLLAHGELITSDIACTSFGVVAGYSFWRWLRQPGWPRVFVAGAAMALAQLSKMSWILLFPLWVGLWTIWHVSLSCNSVVRLGQNRSIASDRALPSVLCHPQSKKPPFKQLISIFAIAVYFLNLGYAFDGFGTQLKDFRFVSSMLTGEFDSHSDGNVFRNTWVGELPVLLPKQYVLGFDSQKKDFEDYKHRSFLCGQWRETGWWWYYVYGLLIKVPCGTLCIFAVVVLAKVSGRCRYVCILDELVLLTPAILLFAIVSSQTEFSIHLRYVFPCLGFGFVYLGQAMNVVLSKVSFFRQAVMALVLWSSFSCLICYPDHLSYFNEFVGHPRNRPKHLLGSSLDWGQGINEVVEWIMESEWNGQVEWSVRHESFAAALLEQRRRLTGVSAISIADPVRQIHVYDADIYYDPLTKPEAELILHRFPFGTVVVLETLHAEE